MDSTTQKDVVSALAHVVREALVQSKKVHIPDLGTFSVQHRLSQVKQQDDGRIVMTPPQDAVTFKPDEPHA